MKAKLFLAIAAVALLAIGCSEKSETVPETAKGISFKATVKPAKTKAVTDAGNTIEVNWAVNETIALIYSVGENDYNATATITDVSGTGVATITATLEDGVADGDDVILIYPSSVANGATGDIDWTKVDEQDGTLCAERDIRMGWGTLAVDGSTASLNGGAALQAIFPICKFSIKDADGANDIDLSSLKISDEYGTVFATITPTSPTSTLYVTMPAEINTGLLWFEATSSDGKPYIAKGTANLSASMFYTPTVKMATIGNCIGANGKFYKNKTDAVAAGTLVSAVIVYLGEETAEAGYTHGLAIAIYNAGGSAGTTKKWSPNSGTHNPRRYTSLSAAIAAKESGSVNSAGKDDETNFPAFYAALHNDIKASNVVSGTSKALPSSGTSGWFLPSAFQWSQILKTVNGVSADLTETMSTKMAFYYLTNCVKNVTGQDLIGSLSGSHQFHTSSEYDADNSWQYNQNSPDGTGQGKVGLKTASCFVVATLAF